METLDLGGIRLHILVAWPGLPGESERIARAAAALDPAIVLADLDTEEALRVREALGKPRAPVEPSFIDGLFAHEANRRFAESQPYDHPFLALARMARDRRWEFIPLRPVEKRPGFFARGSARRHAASARAANLEGLPVAFAEAMRGTWDAATDANAMEPRLMRGLREGRAPVLAVVQAHRIGEIRKRLEAAGRIPA